MANCHEMKMGEVYTCKECGLELKVIKECRDAGKPATECNCHPEGGPCTFSCCGYEMIRKTD